MVKKKTNVAPKKSRGPFLVLIAVVLLAGAAGIWYSTQDTRVAPIALDPNTPLPESRGYVMGDTNAPVEIIEYGDFECPGCMQFATMIEPDIRRDLVETGKAYFRFYDYPLSDIHPNSMSASLAAACADEQGKFWEMHDAIFQGFYDWIAQKTANPKKVFQTYLAPIGINEQQWSQCFDSQKYVGKIMAHRKSGSDRGVSGTPTFIINNAIYDSRGLSSDRFRKIVDSLAAITQKPAAVGDTARK